MKHRNIFSALLIVIATAPCYAMEKYLTLSKMAAISALATKAPESLIGLPHNRVAILGDKSCDLYDFVTGEKIIEFKKFDGFTTAQYMTAGPDSTKLALYRANNLSPITPDTTFEIYDLTTNKTVWNNSNNSPNCWQGAPAFYPHDNNTIFIGNYMYGMTSFNYKKTSRRQYDTPFPRGNRMSFQTQIRFHPTKQEMIFLADTRSELPILHVDEEQHIVTIKELISTECTQRGDSILNAHYSPNGSLIAIIHQLRSCSLFDLTSNTNHFLGLNKAAAAIAFHPTEPFIAVLPVTGDCIEYYDINSKKLIVADPLATPYVYNPYTGALRSEPISFSHEGDKLLIALTIHNKVLIVDMPPILQVCYNCHNTK